MKNLLTLLFIINAVTAFSQSEQEKQPGGYVLNGELSGASGKKIYLAEASFYKTVNAKDSTVADANGKFTFTGKLPEATYYTLGIENLRPVLYFILENANIHVKGKTDSIWVASISGSKENEIRSKAQALNNKLQKPYDDAEKAYHDAYETKDSIAIKSAIKLRTDVKDASILKVKDFMNTYPGSFSAINFLEYLIEYGEPAKADSILTTIEKSGLSTNGQVEFFRKKLNKLKLLYIGKQAPDFARVDTAGNPVKLSSFKGKYTLIDFWASWCGPCREANPALVALYNRYNSKKFSILSVSLDDNKANWLKAIRTDKLQWTHVSDLKGWKNEVADLYGIDAVPQNYLISDQGKIMAVNLTVEELDAKLKAVL